MEPTNYSPMQHWDPAVARMHPDPEVDALLRRLQYGRHDDAAMLRLAELADAQAALPNYAAIVAFHDLMIHTRGFEIRNPCHTLHEITGERLPPPSTPAGHLWRLYRTHRGGEVFNLTRVTRHRLPRRLRFDNRTHSFVWNLERDPAKRRARARRREGAGQVSLAAHGRPRRSSRPVRCTAAGKWATDTAGGGPTTSSAAPIRSPSRCAAWSTGLPSSGRSRGRTRTGRRRDACQLLTRSSRSANVTVFPAR
jgi:hypothetical protein